MGQIPWPSCHFQPWVANEACPWSPFCCYNLWRSRADLWLKQKKKPKKDICPKNFIPVALPFVFRLNKQLRMRCQSIFFIAQTSNKIKLIGENRKARYSAALAEGIWQGEAAIQDREGNEIAVSRVILCHRSVDGAVSHYP